MLLCWAYAADAEEIYRWKHPDGSVTYSDQPPPSSINGSKVEPEDLPELHVVPALELPSTPPESAPNQDNKGKSP